MPTLEVESDEPNDPEQCKREPVATDIEQGESGKQYQNGVGEVVGFDEWAGEMGEGDPYCQKCQPVGAAFSQQPAGPGVEEQECDFDGTRSRPCVTAVGFQEMGAEAVGQDEPVDGAVGVPCCELELGHDAGEEFRFAPEGAGCHQGDDIGDDYSDKGGNEPEAECEREGGNEKNWGDFEKGCKANAQAGTNGAVTGWDNKDDGQYCGEQYVELSDVPAEQGGRETQAGGRGNYCGLESCAWGSGRVDAEREAALSGGGNGQEEQGQTDSPPDFGGLFPLQ